MQKDVLAIQKIVDVGLRRKKYSYPMYKNAPRPDGDYAAIRLISSRNPGYDKVETVFSNGRNVMRTTGIRILTFDVLFSRDDEEVIELDNCFFRQDVLEEMRKYGYLLMHKTSVDNETIALETNWEVRAGIRLMFNALRVQETEVGYIEHVETKSIFVGDKHECLK